MKPSSQKIIAGALVKIPLPNGVSGYARILEDNMAFYDLFSTTDVPMEALLSRPILFIVPVFDDIIKKNQWLIVSKAFPLEDALRSENLPPMYRQDVLTNKVELIYPDRIEPTDVENCKGFEKWAVWTKEGIEARLLAIYENTSQPYFSHKNTI